jgi:hypothetical protein
VRAHRVAAPADDERFKQEMLKWLGKAQPEKSIAATLTFDPKRGVAYRNEQAANRVFRRFVAKMNRAVYGNAYHRFEKRLSIVPVLEGGQCEHYHYHALIEVPAYMNADDFMHLLEWTWKGMPCAGSQVHLEPVRDLGWLDYMLKRRGKADLPDAVDFRNLWLNKIAP